MRATGSERGLQSLLGKDQRGDERAQEERPRGRRPGRLARDVLNRARGRAARRVEYCITEHGALLNGSTPSEKGEHEATPGRDERRLQRTAPDGSGEVIVLTASELLSRIHGGGDHLLRAANQSVEAGIGVLRGGAIGLVHCSISARSAATLSPMSLVAVRFGEFGSLRLEGENAMVSSSDAQCSAQRTFSVLVPRVSSLCAELTNAAAR